MIDSENEESDVEIIRKISKDSTNIDTPLPSQEVFD